MVGGGFLGGDGFLMVSRMGCFGLRGLLIIRGFEGFEVGGMQSRSPLWGASRGVGTGTLRGILANAPTGREWVVW